MSDLDDLTAELLADSLDYAGESVTLDGAALRVIVSNAQASSDVSRAGFLTGADASVSVVRTDLLTALGATNPRAAIGLTLTRADGTILRVTDIAEPTTSIVDLSLSANYQAG